MRTHLLAPLVTNIGMEFPDQGTYEVVISYQFVLFPV